MINQTRQLMARRFLSFCVLCLIVILSSGAALAGPGTIECTYRSAIWCKVLTTEFCFPFGGFNYETRRVWHCDGSTVTQAGNCFDLRMEGCCTYASSPPPCPSPVCPCPYPPYL